MDRIAITYIQPRHAMWLALGVLIGCSEQSAVPSTAPLAFEVADASTFTVAELLPLPGGTASNAVGINNQGQVAGISNGAGLAHSHAVLWDHGAVTDLGTLPGGTYSEAYGINNQGQVVGFSTGAGFSGRHAVLWDHGAVADLGTLPGGLQSRASGINSRGEVVGRGDAFAILWTISRP